MARRNEWPPSTKRAMRSLREKSSQPPTRHSRPTPASDIGELQHDSSGFFVLTSKGDRVDITNAEEAGYTKESLGGSMVYRIRYDTGGFTCMGSPDGHSIVTFSAEIKPEYFKPILDQKAAEARFAKEQGNPRFSTALEWIEEYDGQYKSQIDKFVSGLSLGVDMGTIRDRGSRLEERLPLIEYHLRDRSDGRELSEANRIALINLRKLSGEYRAILDLEERVSADLALKAEISARVEQMCQTYCQIQDSDHRAFLAASAENNGRGRTLTEERITQAISLIPQINAALEQASPREISVCGGYPTVPAYENLKEMQQTLATNPSILERREANGEINLLEMPPDIRIAENFIRGRFSYFKNTIFSGVGSFYRMWASGDRTEMQDYKKLDRALEVTEHHGGKNTGNRELSEHLTRLYVLWDNYKSALDIR